MASDYSISVHEAGHLVAAAVLGGTPTRAVLLNEDDVKGRAFYDKPDETEARIACVLAGPLAERRARGNVGVPLPSSSNDMANIDAELANHYLAGTPRERTEEYRDGLELAGRIVSAFWPSITHAAAWLYERGEISGDLVSAIVETQKSKNRNPERCPT